MTLTVTPFVPADYPRILEAAGLETPWIEDRLATGRAYAASGPAYTIWAGEDIAVTLGLIVLWLGRATAWAVWAPAGYRHPGGVHRLTIRYLRWLIQRYRLRRIDAEVLATGVGEQNWARHLGLEPEGEPLYGAGPGGQTMRRYVWVHPAFQKEPPMLHAAARGTAC